MGLDFFSNSDSAAAPVATPAPSNGTSGTEKPRDPSVYYNARLDPKNFLEGPLSVNPATRLRQMLARPGIVVSQQNPHMPRLFYVFLV